MCVGENRLDAVGSAVHGADCTLHQKQALPQGFTHILFPQDIKPKALTGFLIKLYYTKLLIQVFWLNRFQHMVTRMYS